MLKMNTMKCIHKQGLYGFEEYFFWNGWKNQYTVLYLKLNTYNCIYLLMFLQRLEETRWSICQLTWYDTALTISAKTM